MHRHVSILFILLAIAAVCLIVCAAGMLTTYHTIAAFSGMALVLIMTVGFFWATLHLQKIN